MTRYHSLLLIGPTGSGKTPLGEMIEKRGLWKKRCFHFDFGAQLRQINKLPLTVNLFDNEEREIIRNSLENGSLLEKNQFYITKKIFNCFIDNNDIIQDDLIVLNGVPRHVDQASNVDMFLNIMMVIYLSCKPETIFERIRKNIGGDREERTDDTIEDIKRKLRIFTERTKPLVEYYNARKIAVKQFHIETATSTDEIYQKLNTIL